MSKPHAKKKMSRAEKRDNINGFLFALPWIIGFLCFSLIPLLTSFYYSFTSFNPVKAPRAGKVAKILVETGDPIEYGEPLIVIE